MDDPTLTDNTMKLFKIIGGMALALALSPLLLAAKNDPHALPVNISFTNPAIRYVGRFTKDDKGPRCGWPASMVEIKFEGTDLQVKFKDEGRDFWQVILDGKPANILQLDKKQTVYPVVSGLPMQEHTVQLVKRTEAMVGTTQFLGFLANSRVKLLSITPPPHKMEVIGDSISCGFGNEATGKDIPFSPTTENAYLAYGAVAARALHADYICTAWSGKKLWPDNSIIPLYDSILPKEPEATPWDFASWTPDVVVINLATNDFGPRNPEEAGWTKAYIDFIGKIRKNYPSAHIYCMIGPMLTDLPADRKPLTTVRGYIQKVLEAFKDDPKIHSFDSGPQDGESNGWGAQSHPSVKTDQIIGEKLAEVIQHDLGW